MSEYRERELKFDVPDDWQLPDPTRLLPDGGTVQSSDIRLESTYFDTDDLALVSNRLTLRRRTGDADSGWQLKVPDGDARLEISRPLGAGRAVPEPLRDATQGARRGVALRPVATIATTRHRHRLVDADGTALAELALDEVTASQLGQAAVIRRWREVEVELLDGDEKVLQKADRWLRRRGATPADHGSKLGRALDVAPPPVRDLGSLSGLIGSYLDRQHEAIVRGDVALRRGVEPVAAVHDTRVATRRYRSVLRVFRKVLDTERARPLEAELRWFAEALGAVRDVHVMRQRVQAAVGDLPPELVLGPVAARVQEKLAAEEAEATAALQKVMRSRRYYALLGELAAWRTALPVTSDAPAEAVAEFLRKAERTVERRAARAAEADLDAMHRVRKAAKRARYVAELARPALGDTARKSVKRAKARQRGLGRRLDARLAAGFLYRLGTAAGASGENGFTYGLLHERQRAVAEAP